MILARSRGVCGGIRIFLHRCTSPQGFQEKGIACVVSVPQSLPPLGTQLPQRPGFQLRDTHFFLSGPCFPPLHNSSPCLASVQLELPVKKCKSLHPAVLYTGGLPPHSPPPPALCPWSFPRPDVRLLKLHAGFPGGSDSKGSACKSGDLGSIPGLGRSPGGGHGDPLQCSCLEHLMDREASRATVHGVAKSQTQLSD